MRLGPSLDAYLATRVRNYSVDHLLIDLAKAGTIDRLVLGQDDAKPFGLHVKDLNALQAHVSEVAAENGRRALFRAVLQRRTGSTLGAHALSHAWVAGSGRVIPRGRLFDEVLALGGEPDVDGQARLYFRFPDLDHEVRALMTLRSSV